MFCDFLMTFILEKWCKCTFKKYLKSSFLLESWRSRTKIAGAWSGSTGQGTDPRIRIRTPARIHNTGWFRKGSDDDYKRAIPTTLQNLTYPRQKNVEFYYFCLNAVLIWGLVGDRKSLQPPTEASFLIPSLLPPLFWTRSEALDGLILGIAKCRHLKQLTCLRRRTPPPPTLYTCIQ